MNLQHGCKYSYLLIRNIIILLALLGLTACATTDNVNTLLSTKYQSVWGKLYPDAILSESNEPSLMSSFNYAAASNTLLDAEFRWKEFLRNWSPSNGEYEDGMHATLIEWGELELRRVHYLKNGNQPASQEVEELLNELDAEFN